MIPKKVKALIEIRNAFRKAKEFDKADKVREQIEHLGYRLNDNGAVSSIEKESSSKPPRKHSQIAIFGSGEISSIGRRVHETVLRAISKKKVKISIVTTPAGFQPNVQVVHEEIAEFFKNHLTNFHPLVRVVYANTKREVNDQVYASQIEDADYIFIGPGSPTYAVEVFRDSLLYKCILKKVGEGVALGVASAAAIAFSKYSLPVYEIYKVGQKLHWLDGLNMYNDFFEALTIIPHYNNTEGGSKTDTSRCFMGEKRFAKLIELLPQEQKIWGIDEHTGVVIDVTDKTYQVIGKGRLHSKNTSSPFED